MSFGVIDCELLYRFFFFQSSKNSLVKRSSEEKNGSRVGNLSYDSSGFGKDGDSREVKRQKQLNFGLEQLGVRSADHNQAVSNAGALMTNSEPELRTISQPSVQSPKILDGQCANKTVCAFCHASEISEEVISIELLITTSFLKSLMPSNLCPEFFP